ncbi:MAG: hypothetical protein UE295_11390 [Acutalibacteraceae bacterium]|nr:hypothetical protein [Acutalibacteraceae bacterium]
MKTKLYKDIIGIENFYKSFPDKNWFYFCDILEFRYYRNHENYKWYDELCIDLKLSDSTGANVILLMFRGVTGNDNFRLYDRISGFDIINLQQQNIGWEAHYEITDFEDSNIHFYCDEIEVRVISVNGQKAIPDTD